MLHDVRFTFRLVKDTSLVSAIGVMELTMTGKMAIERSAVSAEICPGPVPLLPEGPDLDIAERDLSVAELNALMTDAQRQTYGDDLDPLHPYMWAVKGHYYSAAFYNYPYTFGLLFGVGLYAQYQREGAAFQARYDELLSRTGMANARDKLV